MDVLTLEKIKGLLDNQTKEITSNLKSDIDNVNSRLYKQELKIQHLEKRCLILERKVRRNNIIIFGLDVDYSSLAVSVLTQINLLLDLRLTTNDLNDVYKIGRSEKPPIVVEFLSSYKKAEIFKNKEKLRSLKTKNVAISNDLCEHDRREQKILRQRLKKARQDGVQARITGRQIEIEGKLFTAKDLEESESECDTYQGDSEDDGEVEAETTSQLDPAHEARTSENTAEAEEAKKRKNLTPSPATKSRAVRKKKRKY